MKLNKILYKLDAVENKINILEEKMTSYSIDMNEKCNIQFPLLSLSELTYFEGQLEEEKF